MNFTGPKVKKSRALGVALTPKAAAGMRKRPTPPGQHGAARGRRRRPSEYGVQLLEKQRLRFQYNISERQLRNYFRHATRRKGLTGETLLQSLETRLDALVLRARFARTIYQARQVVAHRHIDPLFVAVIEATEEAALDALCVADTVAGFRGHTAEGLPLG